jgi:hypothetical protein
MSDIVSSSENTPDMEHVNFEFNVGHSRFLLRENGRLLKKYLIKNNKNEEILSIDGGTLVSISHKQPKIMAPFLYKMAEEIGNNSVENYLSAYNTYLSEGNIKSAQDVLGVALSELVNLRTKIDLIHYFRDKLYKEIHEQVSVEESELNTDSEAYLSRAPENRLIAAQALLDGKKISGTYKPGALGKVSKYLGEKGKKLEEDLRNISNSDQ